MGWGCYLWGEINAYRLLMGKPERKRPSGKLRYSVGRNISIKIFCKGRAAISKLNSILWDRDVTSKTKTHIYHAVVKSTITYAAETWCLEAKTTAKLNSVETEFWRRSARISRKDKIRNIVIK